ncbi:unnamed protein product [Pleuronectes platessa]|uniref:Uncharacterized protein n=1 Tax=Pleuronectes platessa TaxID=8262 RepID=A0A9N7UFK5_PLEPL|nr:unnamed protein product [Pleuronectes platessa]
MEKLPEGRRPGDKRAMWEGEGGACVIETRVCVVVVVVGGGSSSCSRNHSHGRRQREAVEPKMRYLACAGGREGLCSGTAAAGEEGVGEEGKQQAGPERTGGQRRRKKNAKQKEKLDGGRSSLSPLWTRWHEEDLKGDQRSLGPINAQMETDQPPPNFLEDTTCKFCSDDLSPALNPAPSLQLHSTPDNIRRSNCTKGEGTRPHPQTDRWTERQMDGETDKTGRLAHCGPLRVRLIHSSAVPYHCFLITESPPSVSPPPLSPPGRPSAPHRDVSVSSPL